MPLTSTREAEAGGSVEFEAGLVYTARTKNRNPVEKNISNHHHHHLRTLQNRTKAHFWICFFCPTIFSTWMDTMGLARIRNWFNHWFLRPRNIKYILCANPGFWLRGTIVCLSCRWCWWGYIQDHWYRHTWVKNHSTELFLKFYLETDHPWIFLPLPGMVLYQWVKTVASLLTSIFLNSALTSMASLQSIPTVQQVGLSKGITGLPSLDQRVEGAVVTLTLPSLTSETLTAVHSPTGRKWTLNVQEDFKFTRT